MSRHCPGMDPANWRIEDIFEVACPACGATIEFWKDDVRRTCSCGRASFNPRLGDLCLSWCSGAEECLGNKDIGEWKAERAGGRGPPARQPKVKE